MEKRKPHFPLKRVKALVSQGAYRVTASALKSATRDYGYTDAQQLAACVLQLNAASFYKSMTTYQDAKIWQDVYHPKVDAMPAYLKLQIVDETTVVISFKRLEED
ncbi:MAG: type II toxin-antitoxin system MqsR family toxin [Candidatus Hydrogenedens sp.]|nr:type II toxin-antitoxin system MqsR family toxin [Candidatus Hydrogenedens sp.]